MSIKADIQSLAPGSRVEFYVLDATALGGGINRLHAGVSQLGNDVQWQGQVYSRFPVKASGFEYRGGGTAPRPKVQVSNVGGVLGALLAQYDDLVGATFTRKRTLVKYLDAVNFFGGVNATADPTAAFPDEVYFVDRKSAETREVIEWELASISDLTGVRLPLRQVTQSCTAIYRSAECGYFLGPVADRNNVPTTDVDKDYCSKTLVGCRLRFGQHSPIPFGGFPGAGLFRG